MALPGSSGGLGNYHADVLGAVPDGLEAISRLTDEIKSRAVGSIKQGNYPEAITLYSKAIEVQQPQGSESVVAVLYANRSMCHLKMGNALLAHEDAAAAIAKDAAYLKGYYRNGMALVGLKKLNQARETFAAGLALKPDDREIREQLDKLAGMGDNEPTPAPAAAPAAAPASGSGVKAASSKSSGGASAPAPASASASTSTLAADKDEGEIDGVFRGYKKTSDGRMTTFFNNELDAATKELIGDIAPKRLDAAPSTSTAGVNGSAWNSAGTFESVNWTRWATDRLKELLLAVAFNPDAACAVTVTEAKLEGDAEIVSNRGKVKRIYDFSLTLKWRLGAEASAATGVMEVRDVTADEDYEVGDCKVDDGTSPALQELFRRHIKSSSGAMQKAVFAALHTFAEEFKSKV